MKNSHRIVLGALTSVVLFGSGFAQTAVPEGGLIGKRYAGADFIYAHYTGSALDHGFGAVGVVNGPLSPSYDLTVSYAYLDTSGDRFDAVDKNLNVSLLTHRATEYGTAYFAGTFGHVWNRVDRAGTGVRGHGAFWGIRAGYEVAVGTRSAVNLGVGFADGFERSNTRAEVLRFYGEANHWFSRDMAGVASMSYHQLKSSPDAIVYTLGLRWAF